MDTADQLPGEREAEDRPLDCGAEMERPWSTPGAATPPAPRRAPPSAHPPTKGEHHAPAPADTRITRGGSSRLLTVEEVAAWLRVSEATVRNKYRTWGLTPQKVGRLLRFRERDITNYLDEHYG